MKQTISQLAHASLHGGYARKPRPFGWLCDDDPREVVETTDTRREWTMPRRRDLGPKQIAWLRANVPLFACMQDRAIAVGREQPVEAE